MNLIAVPSGFQEGVMSASGLAAPCQLASFHSWQLADTKATMPGSPDANSVICDE